MASENVAAVGSARSRFSACAQGQPNRTVARELHVAGNSVGKWRDRFRLKRLQGLADETRWSIGANYWWAGHNANVKVAFARMNPVGHDAQNEFHRAVSGVLFLKSWIDTRGLWRRNSDVMKYDFLLETYRTEQVKVLSVWSEFKDEDLPVRPRQGDPRGRSVHEQMVHQCVSEDAWFRTMLGIDVGAPPLPQPETRTGFLKRYAEDSRKRLAALREKDERWWEEPAKFFDVERSRAWVMTRRLTHTSHHRGQQMAMLRMLGRDLHSNYGPTADTGGLMQNHAPTIYAYASLDALLEGEDRGGAKSQLPGPGDKPVTERPDERA